MAGGEDRYKKISQIAFNSKKYVFLQNEYFWLFCKKNYSANNRSSRKSF